jgi:hypothetical protein
MRPLVMGKRPEPGRLTDAAEGARQPPSAARAGLTRPPPHPAALAFFAALLVLVAQGEPDRLARVPFEVEAVLLAVGKGGVGL